MPQLIGTVTQWLKPHQPLALWWQRNYPGLRQLSKELATRLSASRSSDQASNQRDSTAFSLPVDTPDLRYYDYGLVGGAIDYRMRMEFTPQWGGDPARSAFTRAWAGNRGSLAHASAALLADCAPMLSQVGAHTALLAESLPHIAHLLEERSAQLDELAPWDWTGAYAASQREENWLLDYCIVLGEMDNFYRSCGTQLNFTPLLSPSGYRSALYASGRSGRSDFWAPGGSGSSNADGEGTARRQRCRCAGRRRTGALLASLRIPLPDT